MPINVANLLDADKRSCVANEAITMGMLIKMSDNGAGKRLAKLLLDADTTLIGRTGTIGVAYKLSTEAYQVATTTAPAATGDRTVAIVSGEQMIELRRGSLVEYTADLLHSSLDPSRAGTTPVAGADLYVKGSQWCSTGTASSLSGAVIGRVFRVFGKKVVVELV